MFIGDPFALFLEATTDWLVHRERGSLRV